MRSACSTVLLVLAATLGACTPPTPTFRDFGPPSPVYLTPAGVPGLAGFSQAVRVGTTLYLSGQVALDSSGAVVGRGDVPKQLARALDNLETVVRAAHGLPADLVKLTVYVVNYKPADYTAIREAVSRIMPEGQMPALTLVGVQALPAADLLVAVDGTAVLRAELPDRERDPRRGARR
jgi:enamine deaminase RidA (YjgF/YER057c/UK114 family)